MATSAGRNQLITAARIWHEGQAHQGWGISVDGQGRIQELGPLTGAQRPTLHFDGKIVVPALIDAFAPGCLSKSASHPDYTPHPAEPPAAAISLGYPQLSASPSAVYARLRAAMLSRLRCGIVCVGIPHILSAAGRSVAGSSPYPLADLMVAAAQDVGMRVAICAGPASDRPPIRAIEELSEQLRGLVGHIVSFADLRLSWALVLPEPDTIPLDALVSLKLRMAHLPLLLAAEPLGRAQGASPRDAGAALYSRLTTWLKAGLLDAATSVLLAQSPPPSCAGLLASVGTTFVAVRGLTSPRSRDAGEKGQGALGFGLGPEPSLGRRPPIAGLTAWQRPAGVALGLRTPGWGPGRWADLMTLPWPLGPNGRYSAEGTAHWGVLDVMVAGQLVLRNGRHRFDDPPAPA